jgi:hypothetical protein
MTMPEALCYVLFSVTAINISFSEQPPRYDLNFFSECVMILLQNDIHALRLGILFLSTGMIGTSCAG